MKTGFQIAGSSETDLSVVPQASNTHPVPILTNGTDLGGLSVGTIGGGSKCLSAVAVPCERKEKRIGARVVPASEAQERDSVARVGRACLRNRESL